MLNLDSDVDVNANVKCEHTLNKQVAFFILL